MGVNLCGVRADVVGTAEIGFEILVWLMARFSVDRSKIDDHIRVADRLGRDGFSHVVSEEARPSILKSVPQSAGITGLARGVDINECDGTLGIRIEQNLGKVRSNESCPTEQNISNHYDSFISC